MAHICPSLLATGVCEDASCSYSHTAHSCDICGMLFPVQALYSAHLLSKKHLKKASGNIARALQCPVCNKVMVGNAPWVQHVNSQRHRNRCRLRGLDPNIEPDDATSIPGHTFCVSCNVHIPNKAWDRHQKGSRHASTTRFAQFQAAIEDSEQDKNGVAVTGNLDFDILEPPVARSGKTLSAKIELTAPSARVKLVNCTIASGKRGPTSTP